MIDVIEKEKQLAIQLFLVWVIITLLAFIWFETFKPTEIAYLPVDDVNLESVNPSLIIPEFVIE